VKTTDLKEDKIKEICALYSTDVFLNDYQIELLKWISKYYFSLIHASTSLFFPKNLI
jgi:primosomal protein N'